MPVNDFGTLAWRASVFLIFISPGDWKVILSTAAIALLGQPVPVVDFNVMKWLWNMGLLPFPFCVALSSTPL